jgi:Domain of unknown function (DUF4279)
MRREITATFQISSEHLSSAELLQRSGLTAAVAHNRGEPISGRQGSRAFTQSILRVDSRLSNQSSVAEHLGYLVSVIQQHSAGIRSLPPECGREIWFKISHDQGQLGLELPADLLSALAPLNVSILFDIYAGSA